MVQFLDKIREPEKRSSVKAEVAATIGALLLGVALGLFSKYLDYSPVGYPPFLAAIDNAVDLHSRP